MPKPRTRQHQGQNKAGGGGTRRSRETHGSTAGPSFFSNSPLLLHPHSNLPPSLLANVGMSRPARRCFFKEHAVSQNRPARTSRLLHFWLPPSSIRCHTRRVTYGRHRLVATDTTFTQPLSDIKFTDLVPKANPPHQTAPKMKMKIIYACVPSVNLQFPPPFTPP